MTNFIIKIMSLMSKQRCHCEHLWVT